MRILFLLTQDLESPYGVGRCLPLANELVGLGHQVCIAALHSDFDSLENRQQTLGGVEIHYVAPMHVMKRGNIKTYYRPHQLIGISLWATLALSRAALTYPTDIVFVGKPHPMNGIAGLLAKVLRRKPIIVDCDDYEAGSGKFSGRWQRSIIEFFEKKIPRFCNKVTTNTYFMRDNLIAWGIPARKITYLPNGVDPKRFEKPIPQKVETERKRLKLENKIVIAYIGSLSLPSHPVDILIKAFSELQPETDNSILLIVGGGDEMLNLQNMVHELGLESSTRFVGRVPQKDIPLYYALADVSTDPIYNNTAARGRAPLKLFESWICSVPFVSADVGDRAFLLGEPPAGVLVNSDEKGSLAKGIKAVISDNDFKATLVARGKERCKDFYWERIAKSLENIFFSTLN
jgi:glycosyltransferase involved in cell wall biosynthesis